MQLFFIVLKIIDGLNKNSNCTREITTFDSMIHDKTSIGYERKEKEILFERILFCIRV